MSEPLPLAAADARLRGKPGRPRKVQPEIPVVTVAPRLLDLEGAARYLGVSSWSVRALIDSEELHPVTLPGSKGEMRRILLDREDLDRLVERSKDGARG